MAAELATYMRQMPFFVPLRLSVRGGLAYRTKMVDFDLGFGLVMELAWRDI